MHVCEHICMCHVVVQTDVFVCASVCVLESENKDSIWSEPLNVPV